MQTVRFLDLQLTRSISAGFSKIWISESTPRYISDCDGISFLHNLLKRFPEHRELRLAVLDLFAYLSLNGENN